MDLIFADALSGEAIAILAPHCARIEVVGSTRRRQPFPRDIDLLLIPGNQGRLAVALNGLGTAKRAGRALEARTYRGVGVDIYFATPETWATLLLIRTGSKAHNIRLTTLAKRRGWHLHASGRGLTTETGARIAGDTEESFFRVLEIPYLEPWQRD